MWALNKQGRATVGDKRSKGNTAKEKNKKRVPLRHRIAKRLVMRKPSAAQEAKPKLEEEAKPNPEEGVENWKVKLKHPDKFAKLPPVFKTNL